MQDKKHPLPYSLTIKALSDLGPEQIPTELRTDTQLIYNSPAALDFNSPGAQGFGVKRAGLAVPGSIMMLIAPGCCGRNTKALQAPGGYGTRFAYLMLSENDIVTGKHLKKIPEAAEIFIHSRPTPPTVLMICITCVDALLGTDMDRICRQIEDRTAIPARPCYMYALTRESRLPPMTAVRQTVYSLLKPRKKRANQANLLGYFSPIAPDSELFALLQKLGIRHIGELACCKDFSDYEKLSAANFNLVLNPEARHAADWFRKTLNIPAIELKRLYEIDKIARQYEGFARIIGAELPAIPDRQEAETAQHEFCTMHPSIAIAVGSRLNADPFELALALVRAGLHVKEIYAIPLPSDFFYIRRLADCSPDTRLYTNLSPSMLNERESDHPVDLAIGADACYYHPHAAHVLWNEETQPFGYQAVCGLFRSMTQTMKARHREENAR
ncbi:oxidoreductase [Selenomonas sp. WCA-380-WT-3B 3/]|uniref:Oxidoreductase n=1 Tax=Selenomonas montiformis TaxID=2652285 RepID=A0A6I2UPW3_9FIRM|nr:oxidoreductase [Selenomonas montiformis]